jgi:hypothetical protein
MAAIQNNLVIDVHVADVRKSHALHFFREMMTSEWVTE